MSYQTEYCTVRGTKIRMLKGGSGDPLFFFHGANGLEEWGDVFTELAKNYTVYCPEHPGYGLSDINENIDSVEDLAYFYFDLINELNLENVSLIGASLGGWLAVEMAIIAPHKIDKLVLVDAAGIRVEGVKVPDIFMMKPTELVENAYYSEEIKQEIIEGMDEEAELEREVLKNRMATAHLAWNPYFHNPKILNRIHRVTMPTHIVWGKEDNIFPVEYGEKYNELIPQSTIEIIEDAGHRPHEEKSEQFLSTVKSFLEQEEK